MPVLDVGGDMDYGAGEYLYRGLAFFLIPATAGYSYEHLAAACVGFVDMPVVAASRLKRDLCEIAVAGEIFGVCRVGLADRKYHRAGEFFALRSDGAGGSLCAIPPDIVGPHILCKTESGPCLRPSGIERYVCQYLGNLGACYSVFLRLLEVICQRAVGNALRDKRCDCDKTAVAQ